MKQIVLLGSTGTIGVNVLDVVRRHPDRFRIVGLAANRKVAELEQQCREFVPDQVVMNDPAAARALARRLAGAGLPSRVTGGPEAVAALAALPAADAVVTGIVGAIGLAPTLAAVRAGKQVLIANKEPLVMLGDVIVAAARQYGAVLLPLDSEHNAVFQCLSAGPGGSADSARSVRRIMLTASGGPFREHSIAELAVVTPAEACAHPNWVMGRKISVDSASLMNKGLEVIEACVLFGVDESQVEVVVHPQSIVHSLVEFLDGSVLAQLGTPDMRIPIANALGWPERIDSGAAALDLVALGRLEFQMPDIERFPCLALARAAARAGGIAPAILNAANEVAVDAFLADQIRFPDIADTVEHTLAGVTFAAEQSFDAVLAADAEARRVADGYIARHTPVGHVAGHAHG